MKINIVVDGLDTTSAVQVAVPLLKEFSLPVGIIKLLKDCDGASGPNCVSATETLLTAHLGDFKVFEAQKLKDGRWELVVMNGVDIKI